MFWATLFLKYWKRKESTLCLEWGTIGRNIYKKDKNLDFKGFITINAITGLASEYYPKKRRFILYVISFLEALPLLAFTLYL